MVYQLGEQKREGKTKRIIGIVEHEGKVVLESKIDITAGDGEKHETIVGKDVLATRTTCAVLQLLKDAGLPVAYDERIGPNQFVAPFCEMLDYEVIGRRESHGSDQQRNPHLPVGTLYPQLKVEFFAKTSGKKWREQNIPMDDPLLEFGESEVKFFLPHWTKAEKKQAADTGFRGFLVGQRPFKTVPNAEFFKRPKEEELLKEMRRLLILAFLVIEKAWQLQGRRMVDIKIEFGIGPDGKLYIADVIDNDSWRILQDGVFICKQLFRDEGDINEVTRNYQLVADLTERFHIPKQRLVVWTGSPKDNTSAFNKALRRMLLGDEDSEAPLPGLLPTVFHARSFHKEPIRASMELQQFAHEVPNSAAIFFIGRSNGGGPTGSATCTLPAFTVSATIDQCPVDLWSAINTPSDVPVASIREPANAVLAALQVLAQNNPCIYALLRQRQETRLFNVVAC